MPLFTAVLKHLGGELPFVIIVPSITSLMCASYLIIYAFTMCVIQDISFLFFYVLSFMATDFMPQPIGNLKFLIFLNFFETSHILLNQASSIFKLYFPFRHELSKEVVDLLMGAADGAKSLIDASDRLILYVEVARLFGTLGYHRKAAFFSRQVAQLYLQQDNAYAAISAMKVLSLTSKAYHIQSKRVDSNSGASPNVSCS